MSLDATVYCDCFERGHLRTPPLPAWNVGVTTEGYRVPQARGLDLDQEMAFDAWNQHACEHEDGVLLHHYLGNIALIARLRELLSSQADRLPIVSRKVVYDGIHAGDFLTLPDVERMRDEIEVISTVHHADAHHERFLRDFERQLRELAQCALRVRKPIVF